MPLIRVTLNEKQYNHIDKLADAAQVEHGEIVRTLIDLDLAGSSECPSKVIDLVGQLYALVVGSPDVKKPIELMPAAKNRKGTMTTPEEDECILQMREDGLTWREIEEKRGLGHGTVFRAAERARKRRAGKL